MGVGLAKNPKFFVKIQNLGKTMAQKLSAQIYAVLCQRTILSGFWAGAKGDADVLVIGKADKWASILSRILR